MYRDRFGFIPYSQTIDWSDGRIVPLPEFDNVLKIIAAETTFDEFLYPPNQRELLHRIPASHVMELDDISGEQEALRKGVAGLAMHFTGFLFGHRCHFEDWWVDGRVSLKAQSDFSCVRVADTSFCIEQGIRTWLSWNNRMQRVATNALFLHNRTHIYHWDWERFQSGYTVLDAIYKVANAVYGVKAPRHEERIDALCSKFGLAKDRVYVSRITRLRNDLIHEGLWDGGMPGEARGEDSFRASYRIRSICSRLFFALFKIEVDYIRSPWWSLGHFSLSPIRQQNSLSPAE
jgi:hypothetical protein